MIFSKSNQSRKSNVDSLVEGYKIVKSQVSFIQIYHLTPNKKKKKNLFYVIWFSSFMKYAIFQSYFTLYSNSLHLW